MTYNRIVLYFLILIHFQSCRKTTICYDVEIFGHAAMGLDMPNSGFHANSLEAINLSNEFTSLNGIELDVRMSKDGELWLFHDDFLDLETTGKGCVEEKTSNELESIQYTSQHKEKLVKLSNINFESSKHYFFDLKFYNACQDNMINISLFKQKLDVLAQPSFTLILPSKDLLSSFSSSYSCVLASDNIELLLKELSINNWYGGVIRNSKVSCEDVQLLLATGKKVYLYDIRSPKGTKSAIIKKPSGVILDDVFAAQSICK